MRYALGGRDECAVYLDSHAALKEVDRDDKEAFVRFGPEQDPLGTCEQAVCDSDPLSLPQIWVRLDGQAGSMYFLNCHDLALRNYCQAIPRFAQNFHETPRLAQLDVTVAVDDMAKEEVTRKHGNVGPMPEAVASGPDSDHRQEQVKSLCGELVVHLLLKVASHPKDMPPLGVY